MKDFLDLRHPFFTQLWRRVAVVAVIFIWGLVELSSASGFWAVLCFALGCYCALIFFRNYVPRE